MKKLLVICLLGLCLCLPGCREPECTQSTIDKCVHDYLGCLSAELDKTGTIDGDFCQNKLCACLELGMCENTCEYKEWCADNKP